MQLPEPRIYQRGPEIFYDQRLCGCHELDSNQRLREQQAQQTTIHSDRDFVYPVPLAAKRYIRAARMDLLTLLVDQLQS